MSVKEFEVLCPRCKMSMDYISEVERGGEIRISIFYRCPLCGFRVLDERVTIKSFGDSVMLEVRRPINRRLFTTGKSRPKRGEEEVRRTLS